MNTLEFERFVDEQPDTLIEDEDGLYLPTDAEIDRWMEQSQG